MPVDLLATLGVVLTPLDALAVAALVAAWVGIGWWTERPSPRRPSVTALMAEMRRAWMREFVTRDNRILDAQIVASLRQATAFFASTSIFAVGGVLALIGNVTPLAGLAAQVGEARAALVWQIRLVPVALLLTLAFLRFVWSNRVFGYASVMMAAVPANPASPDAAPRAAQAGELLVEASNGFNQGVRAMYFALASLGWLVGPFGLMAGASFAAWTIWSREFRSRPRDVLAGG